MRAQLASTSTERLRSIYATRQVSQHNNREFTLALLLELALHLPRGGAAEGRAARRWRAPFRSTSLCAEEPAANDAAGPKNGQAGKVVPGGHWAASGADFRDQPPRAQALVAGRVPAESRDPRRDFCPKPRPGEKCGPHIDRHLTSRCCRTSSQIVVGHVVNDVRRCGGPIGSKRRQKRRS